MPSIINGLNQRTIAHQQLPKPKPDLVHIGLVQLSTDHTLEQDWSLLKASQASIFSTRVHYSSQLNKRELNKISHGIQKASELIAVGLPMDVMAFGCTSASLVIGQDRIHKLLTEKRKNTPSTNPWTGALEAFKFLSAKKIGLFSPYPEEISEELRKKLIEHGFNVPTMLSLGIQNDTEITFVSKRVMEESLMKLTTQSKLDAIFMSCTNLPILEHIEEFEEKFKTPILCSNSVMFWHALRLAGKKASCPGYGALLNS